ncbi:MAG: hypothetical protein EB098_01910 [Betaproteobacteria bacterium]|nr:hypothetical protein [Betaproteobacteria bacterium]
MQREDSTLLGSENVKDKNYLIGKSLAHTNNDLIMVVWTMSISDPTVIVSKETIMQVDSRKGYENFELLYTGLSSGAINITYREFSPDGLARVAFFQNLTYPVSSKTISFKKFKIEVESVSSENIKFKVLEDGK